MEGRLTPSVEVLLTTPTSHGRLQLQVERSGIAKGTLAVPWRLYSPDPGIAYIHLYTYTCTSRIYMGGEWGPGLGIFLGSENGTRNVC